MAINAIMHFHNEFLLIAAWVNHHSRYFDSAILIDHGSTDGSREIAESLLPPNWRIVDSALENFDAILNDQEVMQYESQLPKGWKMAFNVTEFLFTPLWELKELLEWVKPEIEAIGFMPVCLVDKDPGLPIEDPLWINRAYGFVDREGRRGNRYMHRCQNGAYKTGRHGTYLRSLDLPSPPPILHFTFSPWPEAMDRKMKIQERVPQSDIQQNRGKHHIHTEQELMSKRAEFLKISGNLLEDSYFKYYYREMLNEFGH